jgi:hypothetical protein
MKFIFALLINKERALSSVGSEHLPYKQRVVGSNPTVPTRGKLINQLPSFYLLIIDSEALECSKYCCDEAEPGDIPCLPAGRPASGRHRSYGINHTKTGYLGYLYTLYVISYIMRNNGSIHSSL